MSRNRDLVITDLTKAGFVLNIPKSQLEPRRVGQWLGFTIDLEAGCFRVPEEKFTKLKSIVGRALPAGRVGVHLLASIVGHIMSMRIVIGPIARLCTRALYAVINGRHSWSYQLLLSVDFLGELVFWQTSLLALNARPIWFASGTTRVAFSDASDTGFGGYVV